MTKASSSSVNSGKDGKDGGDGQENIHSVHGSGISKRKRSRLNKRAKKGITADDVLEAVEKQEAEAAERLVKLHEEAKTRDVPPDLNESELETKHPECFEIIKQLRFPCSPNNDNEEIVDRYIYFYALDPKENFDWNFPYTRLRHNLIFKMYRTLGIERVPKIDCFWCLAVYEARHEPLTFKARGTYIKRVCHHRPLKIYKHSDLAKYQKLVRQLREKAAEKVFSAAKGGVISAGRAEINVTSTGETNIYEQLKARANLPGSDADEMDRDDRDDEEEAEEGSAMDEDEEDAFADLMKRVEKMSVEEINEKADDIQNATSDKAESEGIIAMFKATKTANKTFDVTNR